jgi:uncharacterized protein
VDAVLEAVSDGVLATGSAEIDWTAPCRRCLNAVHGRTRAEFQELYTPTAVEGETYPLVHEHVDLELVAREAILLDLPLAPLCKEECRGLCSQCGADLNDGPCSCAPTVRDPRWAALDVLRAEMGAAASDEPTGAAAGEHQPD